MANKRRTKKQKSNRSQKSNKSKKNFKSINCSPGSTQTFTCYSSRALNKIKNLWNKRHPDARINSNNSREIWEGLKNKLSNACSTEKCWLNQSFIENNLDSELKNYTFAPTAPKIWKKNPNEWLSSTDINDVMKQYEHVYPSFIFIGPSPIDFNHKKMYGQCVWNELCNFDLKSYIKQGKNKFGIVFNTDPHYRSGAHWVCMFIDIKKKYIYYFDSNADETPKEILALIDKIKRQANDLDIDLKYYKNTTEHQKSDSECGMYVLFTITQLLQDKMTPESFNNRIPDSEMEHLRKIFFN